MTNSTQTISPLRQRMIDDMMLRKVCTVLLQCHSMWLLRPQAACKSCGENRWVAVLKWTHSMVTELVLPARASRQRTIAIVASANAHRSWGPAVSSLGACLTPA